VRFNGQISRVIPGRFARNIGIATYPLYLINDVIGAVFLKGAYALTSQAEAALAFAMLATCALALSIAAFAEPPIRTVLATAFDRIWRKPQRTQSFNDGSEPSGFGTAPSRSPAPPGAAWR